MNFELKNPDSADEAAAMFRLAAMWLEQHAPEVFRATMRATKAAQEAEQMKKELRWYAEGAKAMTCNTLACDKHAVLETMRLFALDGGKRAARFLDV